VGTLLVCGPRSGTGASSVVVVLYMSIYLHTCITMSDTQMGFCFSVLLVITVEMVIRVNPSFDHDLLIGIFWTWFTPTEHICMNKKSTALRVGQTPPSASLTDPPLRLRFVVNQPTTSLPSLTFSTRGARLVRQTPPSQPDFPLRLLLFSPFSLRRACCLRPSAREALA